jgi:hypothetical protein
MSPYCITFALPSPLSPLLHCTSLVHDFIQVQEQLPSILLLINILLRNDDDNFFRASNDPAPYLALLIY